MAQDVATLMRDLGYDTWSVVGHDRGQGVAFRLALDEADHVRALVILDGVPIVEALERADARFAELWWHWFFVASPGTAGTRERSVHSTSARKSSRSDEVVTAPAWERAKGGPRNVQRGSGNVPQAPPYVEVGGKKIFSRWHK